MRDSSLQNYDDLQEPIQKFDMTDHGSIPLDSNFDFKFILA